MKTNLTILITLLAFIQIAEAQNTWVQKSSISTLPFFEAASFSIGSKGYIGTGSTMTQFISEFWEFDPITNTWTQKANFGGNPRPGAVGFSLGNKGYFGLGGAYGSISSFTNDLWEYDPILNTWSQKGNFPGKRRTHAVSFTIGNNAYVGTGIDSMGFFISDFWEYDPIIDMWNQKTNYGAGVWHSSVGFGIGNKGYVCTGNVFTRQVWEFDPSLNSWSQKADFGGVGRAYATGFNIGSRGYVGPGMMNTAGVLVKDFWEYDPQANVWTQKADFGGLFRLTATGFSIGNRGYIGTGYDGNSSGFNDLWEYTPDTVTAINELTHSSSTSIYPNPCQGSFILSYHNSTSPSIFKIIDAAGKIVYSQKLSAVEGTQKINATALRDGIYYYEVLSDDKVMGVGKLVVVR